MALFKYCFVIAVFFTTTQSFASNCEPQQDSCSFYLCMEAEHQCGMKGYFLAYGYRYCHQTIQEKKTEKFSDEGLEWLDKTRLCLQQKIDELPDENQCATIKKLAVDQHIDCYYDNGFCELARKDKGVLYRLLASSLLRFKLTVPAFNKMVKRCGVKDAIF